MCSHGSKSNNSNHHLNACLLTGVWHYLIIIMSHTDAHLSINSCCGSNPEGKSYVFLSLVLLSSPGM